MSSTLSLFEGLDGSASQSQVERETQNGIVEAHLVVGAALEVLRSIPDHTFDAIVTDPPYGLTGRLTERAVRWILQQWLWGVEVTAKGHGMFGCSWDAMVPGPAVWREALRVVKPGGHMLVFAATRMQDLVLMALRLAGWDVIDSLSWVYSKGMPKGADLSKEDDGVPKGLRRDLKPAHETIFLVRAPLSEGTVAANVKRWGTGLLWIDRSRLPMRGGVPLKAPKSDPKKSWATRNNGGRVFKYSSTEEFQAALRESVERTNLLGRHPANMLFSHSHSRHLECDSSCPVYSLGASFEFYHCFYPEDEAVSPSQGSLDAKADSTEVRDVAAMLEGDKPERAIPDGEASAEESESIGFYCVNKPGRAEKDAGVSKTNPHVTVKPLALMRQLVRLVCPPGGWVLDPFNGSGTTGVAAGLEGCHYTGCDLSAEYIQVSAERHAHWCSGA